MSDSNQKALIATTYANLFDGMMQNLTEVEQMSVILVMVGSRIARLPPDQRPEGVAILARHLTELPDVLAGRA